MTPREEQELLRRVVRVDRYVKLLGSIAIAGAGIVIGNFAFGVFGATLGEYWPEVGVLLALGSFAIYACWTTNRG